MTSLKVSPTATDSETTVVEAIGWNRVERSKGSVAVSWKDTDPDCPGPANA